MRARTSISQKPRYTATLTDFKGVDLNTSPLRVATSRASSMKNFICDNGVNHKRPGWEEQFRIVEGGEALVIHGIFPYNEGATEILLVHAGAGIYRAEGGGQKWAYSRLDDGSLWITEDRSQCFYRDGKAFLVGCGNYLVYGEFDGAYALKRVADIAYVPTTSIGCCALSLPSLPSSSSLDAVNLLTRKRKNTGGVPYSGSYSLMHLDGTVDTSQPITIEGSVLCGEKRDLGDYRPLVRFEATFTPKPSSEQQVTVRITVTDPLESDYAVGDEIKSYNTVTWTPRTNRLILSPYWESPEGKDSVTVTYTAAVGADHDGSRVQDCRFGATFGTEGADDRLFLAGNRRYPNMDIWSEYDDFTYFPDGNTMEVGGAHAAITAYARLSDTTLAVLKEEKAGEPTIFYRTGRERTEADGVTLTQWFPVSAGVAGDGAINPHAVATLSGDVLTLTRGGVHGIVLSSNVASGERYMRERSRPIYRELTSARLSGAAAIVYRNRYYLALPDTGKCFVADAHYKAAFEGSTDYNYEWWVWENVHAACFAEYKDQLIFGTPAGLVCAFTEGVFTDRTYTEVRDGDMLDREDGTIAYSIKTPPDGYDRVVLEGNVYARMEDGETVSLSGKELYVASVDTEARCFTVALDRALRYPLFVCTDGETEKWTGRFIHVTPVAAEWISPIMDLGTNAESKTLLGMTVATEPGIGGAITFGYETRRVYAAVTEHGVLAASARQSGGVDTPEEGTPFSFEGLDFEDLTFDASFAHSYTRRTFVRNFNFIVLRFGSDTDADCAVSGITLQYKINKRNKGVR